MLVDTIWELSRNFLLNKNRPYVREICKSGIFNSRFVILTGQRGVGKTTALIQHIHISFPNAASTPKVLYVPCDHFKIGKMSIYEITEHFVMQGGELLCLDEIHKVPDWAPLLKSMYDTFPDLKVIASGSSALKIKQGVSALARRVLFVHVPGFSLREFLELNTDTIFEKISFENLIHKHEEFAVEIVSQLNILKEKIIPYFNRFLKYGYYPYSNEYTEPFHFWNVLEQDIHLTIEMDLLAVHPELTGVTVRKLHKLLSIISTSVPFTPDLTKLKKALEIRDDRTLKSYLLYLEEGGLIAQLMKGKQSVRQLLKPEKIYLNNTNQIFALSPQSQPEIGNIRETFFCSMVSGGNNIVYTHPQGDFLVNDKYVIEVGGAGKDFTQIRNIKNSYLFVDNIEFGNKNRVPLWLAGFVY